MGRLAVSVSFAIRNEEKASLEYTLKKYADRDFKKSFPDYSSFDWSDR